jgi:hypothetical protein
MSAGWNSNSQLPEHDTMDTPTWAGKVVVVVGAGPVVVVVVDGGLVVGGDVLVVGADVLVVGADVALVVVGTVIGGWVSEVTGDVIAVVLLDLPAGLEIDLLERLCVPEGWRAVTGPL